MKFRVKLRLRLPAARAARPGYRRGRGPPGLPRLPSTPTR